MYLCNPLEKILNVTKNVNHEELERMKIHMRSTLLVLESSNKNKNGKFGLLTFFDNKNLDKLNTSLEDSNINVESFDLKALFDDKKCHI